MRFYESFPANFSIPDHAHRAPAGTPKRRHERPAADHPQHTYNSERREAILAEMARQTQCMRPRRHTRQVRLSLPLTCA